MDKKGISQIIGISLLIVVSVLAVIGFKIFYVDLIDNIGNDYIVESNEKDLNIMSIIEDKLYFQSNDLKVDLVKVVDSSGVNVCKFSYWDLISDDSTVGHWSFEAINGTSLVDLSSSHNDGIIYGGLENNNYEKTYKGNFLEFDGGDDYVKIVNKSIFDTSKNFTFSIWAKLKYTPYGDFVAPEFLNPVGNIIRHMGKDVLYLNTTMGEGYVARVFMDNLEGGYYIYDRAKLEINSTSNEDVYRMELWDVTNNIELTDVTCGTSRFESNVSYEAGYSRSCSFKFYADKSIDYEVKVYYLANVNVSLEKIYFDVVHRTLFGLVKPNQILRTYGLYSSSGFVYCTSDEGVRKSSQYYMDSVKKYEEPMLLTLVYDESKSKVKTYVNGVLKGHIDDFNLLDNIDSYLTIGNSGTPEYVNGYFIGAIGEMKIWDKVLSDFEIEQEYLNKEEEISFVDVNKCGLDRMQNYNVVVYTDKGIFEKVVSYE